MASAATSATVRIAFLGDINGAPGRMALEQQMPNLRERFRPDRIIANAENARNGSGLTPELFDQFRRMGVDACTLGDHAFREAKIIPLLDDPTKPVARPANLSTRTPGKRLIRIPADARCPREIFVFTLLGRIHIGSIQANDPFECADLMLAAMPERNPIVLVEVHMEVTSEKAAMAHPLCSSPSCSVWCGSTRAWMRKPPRGGFLLAWYCSDSPRYFPC